jgi:O-antigen/teichoic acid export membrane protein
MGATEIVRAFDGHYAVLVLALVGTVAQVGEFKVAAAISLFLLLPYSIFNSVAVPVAARLFASGRKPEIQRFASLAAVVSTALAVLATLGLLLVGRFLIVAVFGEAFAPAWGVLIVLCLAQIIHAAFGINPAMLNAMGHEVTVFRWFLVSLLAGVAAALALAPVFGSYGMAWAIVLAAVVRVTLLHRHTVRQLGIDCSVLAAWPALSRAPLRES